MDVEPNHYGAPSAAAVRAPRRPLDHLRLKYFYLASLVAPVVLSFNVWWMFASNHRIARGLGETLAKYRTRVSAPTVLAWVGPALVSFGVAAVVIAVSGSHTPAPGTAPTPPSMVTMFLPFLGLSPFLWFAWMVRVDSCQQEIVFRRSEKKARKASRDERDAA